MGNNNHYKVTIITPIYNSELFIERCVKSLFNQDLDNIEYIFINDYSSDNSLRILKSLIENSPRKKDVKLLENKENLGVAKTRKRGMLEATGDFVIQIDADDWIDSNMISTLYNKAIENNSDIVTCDHYISFITGKETYRKEEYKADIDFNIRNILLGNIRPSFWSTLIRRDLYMEHHILPQDNFNIGEDYAVLIQLFLNTEKITYIPKAFLHYTQYNENSITKTMSESILKDTICFLDFFGKILEPTNDRYIKEFRTMVVFCKKIFVLNKHYTRYFYIIYPDSNKFKYIFNNNGYGFFQKITLSFMLLRVPLITRIIYKSYRWLKKKYRV